MSTTDSKTSDSAKTVASPPGSREDEFRQRKLRWPMIAIVLFWIAFAVIGLLELPMFTAFLARSGVLLLLLVLFTGWWLVRGPMRLALRFAVLGWAIVVGGIVTLLMHRTVLAVSVFFLALPLIVTGWTIWLVLARHLTVRGRLIGMLLIPVLLMVPGILVRMEGLRGDGQADFHWRWNRTAEENLLTQSPTAAMQVDVKATAEKITATADDWTDFRGPQRDGVIHGVKIATNWDSSPPPLVWRIRVGPAWSSVIVVGNRLYTQEQRGDSEVVNCVDVDTGKSLWTHRDQSRFEEPLGGIGPRATPTFADGLVFALGARGRLNCLDAATGEKRWSQEVVQNPKDPLPVWGFSGSPLVVDGKVIVFGGGQTEKALLAYDAVNGKLLWKAIAGKESYSSPQAMTLHGQNQILMVGDEVLYSYVPDSGQTLWQYKPDQSFGRPVIQPRIVGDSELLVSFVPDAGVTKLSIAREGDAWKVSEVWNTHYIKPDFSDLVHHDGHIYGFDGSIFCCVDLATGKRQWKGGRYGAGQVLLLADQPILLVITEQGELVLVETNPAKHHELARFQAIEGKTWNHPVISHGKLFVRNAEEMACFRLVLDTQLAANE